MKIPGNAKLTSLRLENRGWVIKKHLINGIVNPPIDFSSPTFFLHNIVPIGGQGRDHLPFTSMTPPPTIFFQNCESTL